VIICDLHSSPPSRCDFRNLEAALVKTNHRHHV
jgi:hypothetical protein